MINKNNFGGVFNGLKVLLTGHTGFKGSWLSIWLKELGAQVYGYSLPPSAHPNNFDVSFVNNKIMSHYGDIRDYDSLKEFFDEVKPALVIHMAAQAIVLEGYKNPKETFESNVLGTINVLEAIRLTDSVKAAIIVTSDKCYENDNVKKEFFESDRMGGSDPYSASKGMVELAVASYIRSFPSDKNISSVRAGNVIGGGDFADNRIIPDCMRALMSGNKILIRNPYHIRPWQHVLEALSGYLSLASKLLSSDGKNYIGGWNFGPHREEVPVQQLVDGIILLWGSGGYEIVGDVAKPHESSYLSLNWDKARTNLSWSPSYSVGETLEKTVSWFREFQKNNGGSYMYDLCVKQISDYSSTAKNKGISWALD